MVQEFEPVRRQNVEENDVLEKIKKLKDELNDMEIIVKEEYIENKSDDESISRLRLRLKEIEEQIVRIVEKS